MRIASPRLAAVAACVSAILASGCARGERAGSDTAGMTTGTTAGATTAAATMTDGNIVAIFDGANIADSSLAAQALPKITRRDVREFANMMMTEHGALRARGLELARKPMGALPPWPKAEAPASDPLQPLVDAERSAIESTPKGAAFDSTYIAHEIQLHQAVVDWATQAEQQAQHPDLKGLIQSAAPIIKKHLDRAHALAGHADSTGAKTP